MDFLGSMGSMGFEDDLPDGYRLVGPAEGLVALARPLEERCEDPNVWMKLASSIWNEAPPGAPVGRLGERSTIVNAFRSDLGLEEENAVALMEEMLIRKEQLFPPELQPRSPMRVVMLSVDADEIEPFDHETLDEELSPEPLELTPPEVAALVEVLRSLDGLVRDGASGVEREAALTKVRARCAVSFGNWLHDKGAESFSLILEPCVQPWLDYLYGGGPWPAQPLAEVSMASVERFLFEYLPRRVSVPPAEYLDWPPAIGLFHEFLAERGFVTRGALPDREALKALEPRFLEFVRRRYAAEED